MGRGMPTRAGPQAGTSSSELVRSGGQAGWWAPDRAVVQRAWCEMKQCAPQSGGAARWGRDSPQSAASLRFLGFSGVDRNPCLERPLGCSKLTEAHHPPLFCLP